MAPPPELPSPPSLPQDLPVPPHHITTEGEMRLQGKDGEKLQNSLTSISTTASVSNPSAFISPSNLPEDIILSILKRLPVKSILSFKCVSKDWLSLLSTPNFISMHREAASKNPLNCSVIVHDGDQMSLFNVNSDETEPISLVIPSPVLSKKMYIMGCANGLLCLSCYPPEDMIILWNPVMNKYKTISPPVDDTRISILGFAYDYVNDDHKIIAVDRWKNGLNPPLRFRAGADVYSSNLDSWKRVQIDFPFSPFFGSKNVTVKGTPYWPGIIEESNQDEFIVVLLYYDMQNGLFKHVSAPKLAHHKELHRKFVEWKGNLGMMVMYSRSNDIFIDILVYDEIEMSWNQISTHGPIGLNMESPIQCSQDCKCLGNFIERELTSSDPVTNGIKKFFIPGARRDYFDTFRYTESLVTIKGMEQVKS